MLRIEVAQRTAPVPPETARYFLEQRQLRSELEQRQLRSDFDQRQLLSELDQRHLWSEALSFAMGVSAVKAVALLHGGTIEFMPIAGRGSVIRSTFSAEPLVPPFANKNLS
jgi:hypothetical protein